MRLILKGVHLSVTERMKVHVREHLVDAVQRFYDDEAAILEVHLVDNNGPKGGEDKECRVTAFIPGSAPLHLTEATEDMFQSIALMKARLVKALKREVSRKRTPTGHPLSKPAGRLHRTLSDNPPDAPGLETLLPDTP